LSASQIIHRVEAEEVHLDQPLALGILLVERDDLDELPEPFGTSRSATAVTFVIGSLERTSAAAWTPKPLMLPSSQDAFFRSGYAPDLLGLLELLDGVLDGRGRAHVAGRPLNQEVLDGLDLERRDVEDTRDVIQRVLALELRERPDVVDAARVRASRT
jgi:hypothetical protein